MNITLSGRLYAVVRTESGEALVITRRERRAPNPTGARETEAARVWRVANPRDTLWVLAGLSAAVIH